MSHANLITQNIDYLHTAMHWVEATLKDWNPPT